MALSEQRKKYLRDWYAKNRKHHRKRIAKNKREWRIKNILLAREIDREKHKKYHKRRLTYGKVKWAVANGKIQKPKQCSNCEKKVCVFAHHEDYNKPLDVVWLCVNCHMRTHSRLASPTPSPSFKSSRIIY